MCGRYCESLYENNEARSTHAGHATSFVDKKNRHERPSEAIRFGSKCGVLQ